MMSENQAPARPETRASLGEMLKAARLSAGFSVDDTARKLLLSPQQLEGLENGDLRSFYNGSYYLKAARKYLALLQLKANLAGLQDDIPSTGPIPVALPPVTTGKIQKRPIIPIPYVLAVLVAGISLLTGAALWYFTQPATLPAPVPVVANEANAAVAAPVAEAITPPAATPAVAGASATSLVATSQPLKLNFTFSDHTWMRYRDQKGEKVEKVYQPKEAISLSLEETRELLIGNPASTQLTLGNRAVDLKPFINTGSRVAHLSEADLRKLANP
jgi:cytoskeletal protein RodZ